MNALLESAGNFIPGERGLLITQYMMVVYVSVSDCNNYILQTEYSQLEIIMLTLMFFRIEILL